MKWAIMSRFGSCPQSIHVFFPPDHMSSRSANASTVNTPLFGAAAFSALVAMVQMSIFYTVTASLLAVCAGEPEVADLRRLVRVEHDVPGLQIPVYDAQGVGCSVM